MTGDVIMSCLWKWYLLLGIYTIDVFLGLLQRQKIPFGNSVCFTYFLFLSQHHSMQSNNHAITLLPETLKANGRTMTLMCLLTVINTLFIVLIIWTTKRRGMLNPFWAQTEGSKYHYMVAPGSYIMFLLVTSHIKMSCGLALTSYAQISADVKHSDGPVRW